MFKVNYHLHSTFSFDGEDSLANLCEAAIKAGLKEIAVTDHCECNHLDVQPYNYKQIHTEFLKVQEQFEGRIKLRFGVELGQATQNPEFAEHLLKKARYDVVLGSLHNLNNKKDFFYLNYNRNNADKIIGLYFQELYELCVWNNFDVLAHMDYPSRYMIDYGFKYSFKKYRDIIKLILQKLISTGKALEINTAGLRTALNRTIPSQEIIEMYKEIGGYYITVGTDAHKTEHIKSGIDNAYDLLRDLGFRYITVYENRKPLQYKIN